MSSPLVKLSTTAMLSMISDQGAGSSSAAQDDWGDGSGGAPAPGDEFELDLQHEVRR